MLMLCPQEKFTELLIVALNLRIFYTLKTLLALNSLIMLCRKE